MIAVVWGWVKKIHLETGLTAGFGRFFFPCTTVFFNGNAWGQQQQLHSYIQMGTGFQLTNYLAQVKTVRS